MREASATARMDRESLPHTGFEMILGGRREHTDLLGLAGGKTVVVYGQTELTRELPHPSRGLPQRPHRAAGEIACSTSGRPNAATTSTLWPAAPPSRKTTSA
ncbi:hypothetical protein [Azotobacter beijerinckii]|uniref:hypothetical protein n=1 Tax=Azotobacter beijerinckii TaxID=170623 RepID=UPI000A615934